MNPPSPSRRQQRRSARRSLATPRSLRRRESEGARRVVDQDATNRLCPAPPLEPGDERREQVAHPRSPVIRTEIIAPPEIEPEQDAIAKTGAENLRDEAQQLAVRPVFDPAGRVVLEIHAAGREIGVNLRVGVAVEM